MANSLKAEVTVEADERVAALSRENERLLRLVEAGPSNLEHDARLLAIRTENAKLKSRNKALAEALANAEKRSDFLEAIGDTQTMRQWERFQHKPSKGTTAVLVATDWHAEEKIVLDSVDYANEYNLEIAERRIRRIFEKAVYLLEFSRGIARIDNLVLAVLGDLIAGHIHEELKENNYLAPIEAVAFAQDMLASGIDYLLKHGGVKSILIPCCHGNHGRVNPKKTVSGAWKHSFEWGMYCQLEKTYRKDKRVAFKIEKGIHNWVEIEGRIVRFHHGDFIKYGGGVGGIAVPVERALFNWNDRRKSDLDVFGHFHQFIDHWRWVCSGCAVGYNEFAIANKMKYQPPTQTFITISREYGKVTALPILLDKNTPPRKEAA